LTQPGGPYPFRDPVAPRPEQDTLGRLDALGAPHLERSSGLSLALALDEGRIKLDDPVANHIPAWKADPLKSKINVLQLATHSSGIEDAAAPETDESHDQLSGWKGDFRRGRSIKPVETVRSTVAREAP